MPTLTAEQFNVLHEASTKLHTQGEIHANIQRMAEEINHDLSQENLLIMPIMKGGMTFTVHLMEKLSALGCPYTMDYIHASHYANELTGQDAFCWERVPDENAVSGRVILLCDDLNDTGITFQTVTEKLLALGAARVETAALFMKNAAQKKDGLQETTYTGIRTENLFLYGGGLDISGRARGYPDLYAVDMKKLDEILGKAPEEEAGKTVSFSLAKSPLAFHQRDKPPLKRTPTPRHLDHTSAAAANNYTDDVDDDEHIPIAHHN